MPPEHEVPESTPRPRAPCRPQVARERGPAGAERQSASPEPTADVPQGDRHRGHIRSIISPAPQDRPGRPRLWLLAGADRGVHLQTPQAPTVGSLSDRARERNIYREMADRLEAIGL